MRMITTAQITKIHAMLNSAGLAGEKKGIISDVTQGRTESSKDLTSDEANLLIRYLSSYEVPNVKQKMQFKIISLAHEMGWRTWSEKKGKYVIDMERLNNWMLKYSYLHKNLNDYSLKELPKLVTQFGKFYQSFVSKF